MLLALDQSSRITGYAIFDGDKLVQHGKFDASLHSSDVGERLYYIRQKVDGMIAEHNIDTVILEDIQLQNNVVNNVQTFKTLAEVFGVIYELCVERKMNVSAVLASSWKSTLGIKGKDRAAQKKAAQEYVQSVFNIKLTQDECDAICIGLHSVKHSIIQTEDFDWSN